MTQQPKELVKGHVEDLRHEAGHTERLIIHQ